MQKRLPPMPGLDQAKLAAAVAQMIRSGARPAAVAAMLALQPQGAEVTRTLARETAPGLLRFFRETPGCWVHFKDFDAHELEKWIEDLIVECARRSAAVAS